MIEVLSLGLEIQDYTCEHCEHRWTSSQVVAQCSSGGFSYLYSEPTSYNKLSTELKELKTYHVSTLRTSRCHNCVDPTLPQEWPRIVPNQQAFNSDLYSPRAAHRKAARARSSSRPISDADLFATLDDLTSTKE